MTTPRPYLWQSLQLRAENVDGLGGVAHYFTEEAQSLYLKGGIADKVLTIEEGHWEDATAGDEEVISDVEYSQSSWHHPATGSLYGTAILEGDDDILYLLRYTYMKDMGTLITSANYRVQVDNPIVQVNADIKNYDSDAFIKDQTLFMPGAKIQLGIAMGDSDVFMLGETYIDQVDFEYNKKSVAMSSRNRIGHYLSEQQILQKGKKTDTATNLCKWVFDEIGLDRYEIEENSTSYTLEYSPSDTGLKLLQDISDMVSGYESGTDWNFEEMADGTIIVGFNGFRGSYLPKSVFKFTESELFKRTSNKSIDGAYSKIYATGKTSGGTDLTPVIENVETFPYWTVPSGKTYFAPELDNTTQEKLADYAKTLAKQMKRTGLNETYHCTIRPQLLVGDYATADGKDIGIINQITHTFSEKGFVTEFVADSGGDKQALLTRSASDEKVYTSARRNKGTNRNRRLIDFIKTTATDAIRTSGGESGGGGGGSGVNDVTVDGVSVVQGGVAVIDLTGKQDVLTAGDRISISQNTISASIAPFSIVDGKMCLTYKGEVD